MPWIAQFVYWLVGLYLTAYAGRTTIFLSPAMILLERPLNACVVAIIWVFVAYKYINFR